MAGRENVAFIDENGVPYGIKQDSNRPKVIVEQIADGELFTVGRNELSIRVLLEQILLELKNMNIQLSLITDNELEVQ